MTGKNKKKREDRQKKELVRLRKFLSLKAMRLLRQQVEQEEHPALKKAKELSATLKKHCDSLFKCADKLDELVEITMKQADALNSWLVDAPKEAN